MVVRQAGLALGLFLGLLRRARRTVCRRLSFSCLTWRMYSRCMVTLSRSIRSSSSSEMRGGETAAAAGEEVLDVLDVLETLRTSSSKASERKRSSSERNEVARGSSCSESDSDERRGHEGKAQLASCVRMLLLEVMSMGADMALMELYEPYEPYMVGDGGVSRGVDEPSVGCWILRQFGDQIRGSASGAKALIFKMQRAE